MSETATKIAEMIRKEMNSEEDGSPIEKEVTKQLLSNLQQKFDPTYGGFGFSTENPRVPKFPQTPTLLFLLDQAERTNNEQALKLLTHTADRMSMGGLQDHLGGGFHRYSVDRYWAIPHFEKMLYDNGQLATVYSSLAKLTGNIEYRRVVEEMMDFIQRDMTSPGGGFYSAMDADSEGEEGKYFRWKKSEWTKLLGPEEATWFASIYGRGAPNFEGGHYVPQIESTWPKVAERLQLSNDQLRRRLDPLRKQLLAAA